MTQSLIREPNHNVVLRSDNVALRFFPRYGGTPLEWWSEPFPLVTNPFPGSGVSVAWEVGQDPTQASANGIQENRICVSTDPTSFRFNYYAREYLFDPAGNYGVTGFLPDFWLSSEWIDDAIAPNPDGSDHGWRTKYSPGTFSNALQSASCPVIFQGTKSNWSGLFFVGNEMDPNPNWNQRLRSYGEGRVAFKLNISLAAADSASFAGVLFRKSVPSVAGISKHEAFSSSGLHLYFYRSGDWMLHKMTSGSATKIAGGRLTKSQRSALVSSAGLEIELQTHNDLRDHLELYFGGVFAASIDAVGCNRGPHVCLFSSTSSGYIVFGQRQIFDVSVSFDALYSAKPDATIVSDLRINCVVPEQVRFYRGALPGVFLNQQTFSGANRRASGFREGEWHDIDGIYLLTDFEKFFLGNKEGTCGVCATFESVEVDGVFAPEAHLLASKHAINDEFVLGVNPLSYAENVTPRALRSMRVKTRWQTKIT